MRRLTEGEVVPASRRMLVFGAETETEGCSASQARVQMPRHASRLIHTLHRVPYRPGATAFQRGYVCPGEECRWARPWLAKGAGHRAEFKHGMLSTCSGTATRGRIGTRGGPATQTAGRGPAMRGSRRPSRCWPARVGARRSHWERAAGPTASLPTVRWAALRLGAHACRLDDHWARGCVGPVSARQQSARLSLCTCGSHSSASQRSPHPAGSPRPRSAWACTHRWPESKRGRLDRYRLFRGILRPPRQPFWRPHLALERGGRAPSVTSSLVPRNPSALYDGPPHQSARSVHRAGGRRGEAH